MTNTQNCTCLKSKISANMFINLFVGVLEALRDEFFSDQWARCTFFHVPYWCLEALFKFHLMLNCITSIWSNTLYLQMIFKLVNFMHCSFFRKLMSIIKLALPRKLLSCRDFFPSTFVSHRFCLGRLSFFVTDS